MCGNWSVLWKYSTVRGAERLENWVKSRKLGDGGATISRKRKTPISAGMPWLGATSSPLHRARPPALAALATPWRLGSGRRIVLSYADQNIFCDGAVTACGALVRRRRDACDIDDEGPRQLHDHDGLQLELVGAWKHPRSPRHADVTVHRSGDLERGPYRNLAVQLACRPGH